MHLGLELSFKLHLVVFGTFTFEILIIYRVLPFLSQMEETCYKLMMKNYAMKHSILILLEYLLRII